jgi:hypothetical protein
MYHIESLHSQPVNKWTCEKISVATLCDPQYMSDDDIKSSFLSKIKTSDGELDLSNETIAIFNLAHREGIHFMELYEEYNEYDTSLSESIYFSLLDLVEILEANPMDSELSKIKSLHFYPLFSTYVEKCPTNIRLMNKFCSFFPNLEA